MIEDYVKIRLEEDRKNKAKGFYLLMTNGNTYSDKLDEFVINKGLLKLLDDNKIKYKQIEEGRRNETNKRTNK